MKATIQFFFLCLVTWVGLLVAAFAIYALGVTVIGGLQ